MLAVDYAVSTSGAYWLGVNTNSDLTSNGYGSGVLSSPPPPFKKKIKTGRRLLQAAGLGGLPGDLDWRMQGRVPRSKSQGLCGSGWVHSGILGLQFNLLMQNPTLNEEDVTFSRQQVLDCANPATSTIFESEGCVFGLPSDVGNLANVYGIILEMAYPYSSVQQPCAPQLLSLTDGPNPGPWADWRVLRAEKTKTIAEDGTSALAIMEALQTGPVSVFIDASGSNFQLYAGGIYKSSVCSPFELNHIVTIVGYNMKLHNEPDFY
eukprot:gene14304-20285_t